MGRRPRGTPKGSITSTGTRVRSASWLRLKNGVFLIPSTFPQDSCLLEVTTTQISAVLVPVLSLDTHRDSELELRSK